MELAYLLLTYIIISYILKLPKKFNSNAITRDQKSRSCRIQVYSLYFKVPAGTTSGLKIGRSHAIAGHTAETQKNVCILSIVVLSLI